jgi:hypothetical protein
MDHLSKQIACDAAAMVSLQRLGQALALTHTSLTAGGFRSHCQSI